MSASGVKPPLAFASISEILPGLILCGGTGLVAIVIASKTTAPAALLALLLGLLGCRYGRRPMFIPGVHVSGKVLLRLGVLLMGARLSVPRLIVIGPAIDLISIAALAVCLASGFFIGPLLRLSREQTILGAGAVAICGASATLALAAILPPSPTRDRHAAFTVAAVTLLSTAAMILYPLLVHALHLSNMQAGSFFGASIHDLTQVLGAGATISPQSLDAATVSKLVRIACLMPVVSLVGIVIRQASGNNSGAHRTSIVPPFLLGFVALAIISGFEFIPSSVTAVLSQTSNFLLIMATAALGFSTYPKDLRACGWRPLTLILIQTAIIGTTALLLTMRFVR